MMAIAVVLLASQANAQLDPRSTPDVRLELAAHADCPDAAWLRSEVERILRREVFEPGGSLVLRVRVAPQDANTIRAELELFDAAGRLLGDRTIEKQTARCQDIAGPLGVVAALLVDLPSSEPQAPPRAPTPAPAAPADTGPLPPKPEAEPIGIAAHGSLVVAYGLLPTTLSPGAGVTVTLASEETLRWYLTGAAFGAQSSRLSVADAESPGGVFSAFTGEAGVCPFVYARPGFEVGICAGMQVGALQGSGTQTDTVESRSRPFVGGALGSIASLRLIGPLVARLHLGGSALLYRDPFYVEVGAERHTVHQPKRLGLQAALGLGIQSW